MNKENCALKLVDEIILYYDVRSKKNSNYSTCFGRFLRPSSGVLKILVAAAGACHGLQPTLDIRTGYISSRLTTCTSF